jgi:uncharacterized protein DUF6894
MPRFHFHVLEDGRLIKDEEGQEIAEKAVRSEAVETGASIARDCFMKGSANQVIVDVRKDEEPFLKVSISIAIQGPNDSTTIKRIPPSE